MTKDIAIKSVEWMFEQSGDNGVSICFFGGEPTLQPDIIDVMCIKGKELAAKLKKPFSVSIITNATIMNETLYNIIQSHLDIWNSCQLSVDGPREIQDENRITKSGKGTFDTIEANLAYWKALFGNKLNVHGVLNKSSIPRLFDSYKYFREVWNEPILWFLPAKNLDYTDEDVELYDREMGKIYNYIMNIVRKTGDLQEIKNYAPLDRALRNGKPDKPCGAGESYCSITASGDIYPCHHFYYYDTNKETLLGNIYDGVSASKKRVWDEYDNSDMKGCEDCEHNHCYRCIAENYEANQTPFSQEKGFHCKFMLIDLKYQRLIIDEVSKMDKGKCEDCCGGCDDKSTCSGNVVDCVGKDGHCPVYVSLADCIFDRGDTIPKYTDIKKV